MAALFLRGQPLSVAGRVADVQAVLFDKDGTISHSESRLLALANTRIRHCLRLAGENPNLPAKVPSGELETRLRTTYGLLAGENGLDPAGITAVAARDHNLLSTAVALTQLGHGWPDSLEIAQEAFRLADLDQPCGAEDSKTTDGFPGVLEALGSSGIHCAVISNDDTLGIESFLEHHGLSQQICAIWSAEHEPRKPDPEAIVHLCRRMGVVPANCVLVGDANSDLRMGHAAGVGVVLGYRGGWQRPVQLEERFLLLDHWSELTVEGKWQPDQGVSMETWDREGKT